MSDIELLASDPDELLVEKVKALGLNTLPRTKHYVLAFCWDHPNVIEIDWQAKPRPFVKRMRTGHGT